MPQIKRKVYAGDICIQDVWQKKTSGRSYGMPRIRFHNQSERDRFNLMRSRRHHALVINENYSPDSLYSTLTFNQDEEIHTYEEARLIRNRYYDVLQYKYPNAKISLYMGRGRSTSRIHFHMLTDGIPKEYIQEKWKYGEIIDCVNLRAHNYYFSNVHGSLIDHGHDYTGLANYLFDHWTPDQGKGKRYKQSKNHRQPQIEKNKACKRVYSANKPPVPPKGYLYVGYTESTEYGYISFKYIKIRERIKHNGTVC